MKGAYDFCKPFARQVVLTLRKAEERELLRRENRARDEIRKENRLNILAGARMRRSSAVARSPYKTTVRSPVSGVGRSWWRALPASSRRAGRCR